MTAIRIPVTQGSDAWLEARKDGIGSSDAPVIAGEKGSVIELWGEKTGLVPRPEPDAALQERYDWGHRMEPLVAAAYTERTDRPLKRANQLLVHPKIPFVRASLDRVSARKGERRIVELKVSEIDAKYAGAELPGDVLAQVQHQLWVTGYDVADVAVLLRYWNLAIFEVPRDEAYIDDLEFLEREFWRWVEDRTMPPLDGSEEARRVLGRLYQRSNGYLLPRSGSLDALAYQLVEAREAAAAAVEAKGSVENAIRAVIGDADGFDGDWGRITWRKNRDSERTDWKSLALAYRAAIDRELEMVRLGDMSETALPAPEDLAALESLYSRTQEGARVLRATFKNEAAPAASEESPE